MIPFEYGLYMLGEENQLYMFNARVQKQYQVQQIAHSFQSPIAYFSGNIHCLFVKLADQKWFVHGTNACERLVRLQLCLCL